METKLSTKGQIVLPQKVRQRLSLRPGARLSCRITNGSIVLTPTQPKKEQPRLVTDPLTGLIVTESPPGAELVTSEQVHAVLVDFP